MAFMYEYLTYRSRYLDLQVGVPYEKQILRKSFSQLKMIYEGMCTFKQK